MAGLRQPGRQREAVTLTATQTLTRFDVGKTFLINGGGAVVITLPDPLQCNAGDDMIFINIADQDLTVGLNEKILTKNNAAADSVAFSTSSEKIGAALYVVCTGTLWAAIPWAEEAVTMTVATD
jgi:hypothetical protein